MHTHQLSVVDEQQVSHFVGQRAAIHQLNRWEQPCFIHSVIIPVPEKLSVTGLSDYRIVSVSLVLTHLKDIRGPDHSQSRQCGLSEKITDADLPTCRVRRQTGEIIVGPSHPEHNLFQFLPSARCYRTLYSQTQQQFHHTYQHFDELIDKLLGHVISETNPLAINL